MNFFTTILGRITIAAFITVLALFPPETLHRDEAELESYRLRDIPIYIMRIEEASEVFRNHAMQECLNAQMPIWRLYFHMNYLNETVSSHYLAKEFLRSAGIIQEAFDYGYILDFANTFIRDTEKARIFWKVRICHSECKKRMEERNDRSPELGVLLVDSIDELKRNGIEEYSSNYYETVADYYFRVAHDEKAFEYLEEAYELAALSGHFKMASHLAGKIGAYHVRMNRLEEAGEAYAESLEYARRLGDPYAIARALAFTAQLRATQLRFIEAEELYRQALSQCECTENPVCEIQYQYGLAKLYYSFGYTERAIYLGERVTLLAERNLKSAIDKEDSVQERALEKCLTGAHSLLAQLEQGRGNLEEAILIMEKVLPLSDTFTDRLYHAELLRKTGDLHLAAGKLRDAEKYFDDALAVFRSLKKKRFETQCLLSIAELEIKKREFDEAEDLLERTEQIAHEEKFKNLSIKTEHMRGTLANARGRFDDAIMHYKLAVALFDRYSSNISYEKNKHALAGRMAGIYSDLFALQSRQPERSDSLIFWSEKQKRGSHGNKPETPVELETKIKQLISNREWIPTNTILIRHLVTDQLLIGICFDNKQSVHYFVKIHSAELDKRVREFFELCIPGCGARTKASRNLGEASRELYHLLIAPFSEYLENKQVICFIPDKPLTSLPFSALLEPGREGKFLTEENLIVTSPSLLDLYEAGENESSRARAEIFNSPLLVGIDELAPGIGRLFPNLKKLHHTRDEVEQIGNLLRSGTLLTGAAAAPTSFLERAEKSDLIHIAAHTIQFPSYSGEAAFILSPLEGNSSHVESSLLFEDSIRELDLRRTKLVVLSSCESASCAEGGFGTGPGLAGAFFQAGAGSVIATIWPIEDRSAAMVMTAIYHEILGGERDAAEALATVQRRIIEEDRASGNPMQNIHIWTPYIALSSLGPGL